MIENLTEKYGVGALLYSPALNGKVADAVIHGKFGKPYSLALRGDWGPLSGAEYEFIAPGSLDAANDMEHRSAVGRQKRALQPQDGTVSLALDPLSAGVVTLYRK